MIPVTIRTFSISCPVIAPDDSAFSHADIAGMLPLRKSFMNRSNRVPAQAGRGVSR
jgi:hypothetical protein